MNPFPNVPFAPKKFPFFYGWLIALVGTLGICLSVPGQTVGVSAFKVPLRDAVGVSDLSLSNAYLVGTLLSASLLPFGGRLLDRYGARITGAFAATLLAVTLCVFSTSPSWGAVGGDTTHFVMLAGGFLCLRFSGQGMLTMISRTMIGRWFDRRRGLVSGISSVGVAGCFAGTPAILSHWVDESGFDDAYLQLGLLVLFVGPLITLLFYRDTPEAAGLLVDGQPPKKKEAGVREEVAFTRKEATRTLGFWTITTALLTNGLVVTATTFHMEDIGAQAGVDKPETMLVFVPMAVVSTVVGFIIGVLADHVRIRSLVIAMMVALCLGIVGFSNFGSVLLRWVGIIGFGCASGCFATIATVGLPRYFGRTHLGAINGFHMMCIVVGTALGPSLLSTADAIYGSYTPGLYACLVMPVITVGLAIFTRNPQPAA